MATTTIHGTIISGSSTAVLSGASASVDYLKLGSITISDNTNGDISFNSRNFDNVGQVYATAYYGRLDSNSGIDFPGSDVMLVSVGGSEEMRLTSTGNLGIGTNAPNDDKLLIAGNLGVTGSLHVSGNISTSGSIIAREFRTEYVNQIIATSSGSTTFGDSIDDVHHFTGSMRVSSSIRVPDGATIQGGEAGDVAMFHNGTNSFLSNSTGDLILEQNADDKDIVLKSDDGSGGNTAYITLDGSAGYTTVQKKINFEDGVYLGFGNSTDGTIYHDGTNMYYRNWLGAIYFINEVTDADMNFVVDDGGGNNITALTIDASDVGAVKLPNDNQYLYIGAGNDCYFGHGGTNSVWGNNTGTLQIRNHTSDADMYLSVNDGGSHINAVTIDASENGSLLLADDNRYLMIGASNDLALSHNGTNTYIQNYTGGMFFRQRSSGTMVFDDNNGVEHFNIDMNNIIVFNEGSNDIDFRVESNGKTSAIFVDAGADLVTIGASHKSEYGHRVDGLSRVGSNAASHHLTTWNNIMTYSDSINRSGSLCINTDIGRASSRMCSIHVTGYAYGAAEIIDFTISFYTYSGANGQDDVAGYPFSPTIVDRGTDGHNKYVGINADGNIAIAIDDPLAADSSWKYYYGLKCTLDNHLNSTGHSAYDSWSGSWSEVNQNGWLDYRIPVPTLVQDNRNVGIGMMTSSIDYRLVVSENGGSTDDHFIVNPANGHNRTMEIAGDAINVTTTGGGSNTLKLQEDGGEVSIGSHLELPYGEINDANSDVNIASTNTIVLNTGGSNRYNISNTGNHSIYGNTSFSSPMSCNYGVIFNEGGNDSDTRIEGSSDANLFRVDAGEDRVGIGTGSPGYKLHVVGTSYFTDQMRIVGATDVGLQVESTDGTSLVGIKDNSTSGDYYNGVGAVGNELFLKSNNVERVRIDSAGLVGISCNPAYKLDVSGSTRIIGGGEEVLRFQNDAVSNVQSIEMDSSRFYFYNRTAGAFNSIAVLNDGSVGIGTTSPGVKLEVIGSVSGSITATGSFSHLELGRKASNAASAAPDLRLTTVGATQQALASYDINYYNHGYHTVANTTTNSTQLHHYGYYGHTLSTQGKDEALVVSRSGDVGIGNPKPTEPLVVEGVVSGSTFRSKAGVFESQNASTDLKLRRGTNDDDIIEIEASATYIYGDSVERCRFGSYGFKVRQDGDAGSSGGYGVWVGGGDDLQIQHDGTNSRIINDTGNLHISNSVSNGNIEFSTNDGGTIESPIKIQGSTGFVLVAQPTKFSFANGQTIYDNGGGGLALNGGTYDLDLIGGTNATGDTRFFVDGATTTNTEKMNLRNGGRFEVSTSMAIKDTLYMAHGGSDYSPAISFMGGTDTAGVNSYENAGMGYYDNSGTGTMLFFGNRGAMNWSFKDDGDTLFLMGQGGDFHANGDVIAASTTTSSDIRLKKNINDIPYGLSEVLQLRAVEFDWKEKRDGKHDIGVIAQEIEKIIPEVVQESKDLNSDTMYKNVDYGKLTAVLIKSIQELTERVEELEGDK